MQPRDEVETRLSPVLDPRALRRAAELKLYYVDKMAEADERGDTQAAERFLDLATDARWVERELAFHLRARSRPLLAVGHGRVRGAAPRRTCARARGAGRPAARRSSRSTRAGPSDDDGEPSNPGPTRRRWGS
jgi:hypothetical protein